MESQQSARWHIAGFRCSTANLVGYPDGIGDTGFQYIIGIDQKNAVVRVELGIIFKGLLTINHQSLVATKANRIARAAAGRPVSEFGSRRAQSYDAAILGARATYIGGCSSYSSSELDAMILQSGYPASSSIFRAFFDR